MKKLLDVCYSKETGQCLDIYLPECETFPVMLYFHGGGLEAGDKSDAEFFAGYLTSHGISLVSADYRMYPDAKYPDFLIDAADSAAWVFKNMGNYGNISGIYIGGSSAGGYISQMLCFDKTWLSAHYIDVMKISGFIHDAGQPTCHFNVLRERGMDSRRVIIDKSSPIYHIDGQGQCPPMLIIVSDNDMENRYEQTMLLISTLKHFGYSDKVKLKIMNGGHCAYVGAEDENGESVFGKIITEFIEKGL